MNRSEEICERCGWYKSRMKWKSTRWNITSGIEEWAGVSSGKGYYRSWVQDYHCRRDCPRMFEHLALVEQEIKI